jgi:hypothetical protein
MLRHRIAPIATCVLIGVVLPTQNFPHKMGPPGVRIEYLGKSDLPKTDKDGIVSLVFEGQVAKECVSPGRSERQEIESIRVARANLGPKEEENLLVQASDNCHCGGTGNCAFWVVRKTAGGLEPLLETEVVQAFSLEKTRTHGYTDILTSSHGSAFLSELTLYQFDGKLYRAASCAKVEYKIREDDSVSDEPTITSEECIKQ